jgi:MEMO1 family protein
MLSEKDRIELLGLAREAIERCLEKKESPSDEQVYGRSLCTRCGVFVSLFVKEKLRGCIGTFSEKEPLYRNVIEMAVSAATADERFPPVQKEETGELEIEISVLSARRKISAVEEIIPGKHGVYIQKGSCKGTFLPQVAVHQGWSAEDLLRNCSMYKAGIGWEGWKSADLYVYEATVFSSRDFSESVKIS